MYIGIFDQDILLNPAKFRPSLELMKISYYHKKRGDVVEFVLTFEDSEKYDILYLSRESLSQKDFPSSFLLQNNLQWVGRGFTGNYVKLPDEIEQSPPDRTFYSTFVKSHSDLFTKRTKKHYVKKILDNDYVLLRITDGNNLLLDYKKLPYQNQKIILYDYDFYSNPQSLEIHDFLTKRGNTLFFLNSSYIKDLNIFAHISQNCFPVNDESQILFFVHNDGLSVSQLLKCASAFNLNRVYYIPTAEKQVNRKAIICALNLYFYNISKGVRTFPVIESVQDTDQQTPYYHIATTLNRILGYKTGITTNTTIQEEIAKNSKSFSNNRLYNINKTISNDRSLYIMFNLNIRKINENGTWRPYL